MMKLRGLKEQVMKFGSPKNKNAVTDLERYIILKTSLRAPSSAAMASNRWTALALCFLIVFMMRGIQASYAVFILPASRDLCLDPFLLVLPATSCMLFAGLSLMIVSPLIDKYGPEAVTLIGACSAGLGIALLSLAQSPMHFHLIYGVVFGSTWMSCGLIATTALASRLFTERSGLAITVLQSAFPLGWFCVVPLARMLIEGYGWRIAWLILGLTLTLIAITAIPLLMGFRADSALSKERGLHEILTPTIGALKCPFYILTGIAIQFICGFTDVPISTLWVPISMELGIDESTASYTLGFMGLATFLGTLTMGVASERFGRKLPVVLSFAIRSVSICVPLLAKSVIGYYTFLTLLGVSFFGMVPVISAWFSEVFGKEVVGSLFGFSQLIHLIGSALGIYFLSYMAEISGTYFPALIVCLALTLINILLSLLVRAPARHAEWS